MEAYSSGEDLVVKVISLQLLSGLFFLFLLGGGCLYCVVCSLSVEICGLLKTRKPYTITKQRERWTEEEHNRFLEALRLYGRAWQKIEGYFSLTFRLFISVIDCRYRTSSLAPLATFGRNIMHFGCFFSLCLLTL